MDIVDTGPCRARRQETEIRFGVFPREAHTPSASRTIVSWLCEWGAGGQGSGPGNYAFEGGAHGHAPLFRPVVMFLPSGDSRTEGGLDITLLEH
jgi:hypothetical protein